MELGVNEVSLRTKDVETMIMQNFVISESSRVVQISEIVLYYQRKVEEKGNCNSL